MNVTTLFKKPYIFWLMGIAFLYISINMYLSKFYLTLWYVPVFFETINWNDFFISVSLTLLIGTLVAMNMILAYLHYQENKKSSQITCIAHDRKATIIASVGAFTGIALGVCSACTPIFFPLLASLFGISISWATIGINGYIFQLILIILLVSNLYYFQLGHHIKKYDKERR